MIEYVQIHKSFDVPVLRGVSLTVDTGRILAVVGPSGVGKSVLLKTTNGLIVPDRGDVRIDGESIFSGCEALEKARSTIGYVFQYAALFDSMTVLENVALGIPEGEARRIGSRQVVAQVSEALSSVRLNPRGLLAKVPAELSGGMRKRVGVARAIVGRPRILLYDEPVTGLDPVTAAVVDRLICGLTETLGATSVVVTHDIEGVLQLCDSIALLDEGRVRFSGTPAQFRASSDQLVQAFLTRRRAAFDASPGQR